MSEQKKEQKFDIKVNRSFCKNCGICICFCPTGVYTQDELGGPVITNPEKCNNCNLCVIRCPDFAIDIKPKKEVGK